MLRSTRYMNKNTFKLPAIVLQAVKSLATFNVEIVITFALFEKNQSKYVA